MPDDFPETLRRLRKRMGWTQQQFADHLSAQLQAGESLSHQAVSAWEKGKNRPGTYDMAMRVDRTLGASGEVLKSLGYEVDVMDFQDPMPDPLMHAAIHQAAMHLAALAKLDFRDREFIEHATIVLAGDLDDGEHQHYAGLLRQLDRRYNDVDLPEEIPGRGEPPVDPATGSGHMQLAASRHLAERYAQAADADTPEGDAPISYQNRPSPPAEDGEHLDE